MAPNAEFLPRISSPESPGVPEPEILSNHEFVTHQYYELVSG